MKKYIFTTMLYFIFLSSTANAFSIVNAKIQNPQVSAGENLNIIYTVDTDAPMMLNSGSTTYLGMIVQNIFPQSMGMNRQSVALGERTYRVSDLVVNPWAAPDREYRVESFSVMTAAGEMQTLTATRDFYITDDWQETQIPVMKFKVNPNPLADTIGPIITNVKTSKKQYFPGEIIEVSFDARDNVSGIERNPMGFIMAEYKILDLSQGATFPLENRGNGSYALKQLRIKNDAPVDRYQIGSIAIMDQAMNWGELNVWDERDEYYHQGTEMSRVPVLWIEIVSRSQK